MAEEQEEIEVIDVTLTEEEIDEMIAHLMDLKEHKTNVQFPLASDLDLSVTFTNDENAPDAAPAPIATTTQNQNSENKTVESDKQMQEIKEVK